MTYGSKTCSKSIETRKSWDTRTLKRSLYRWQWHTYPFRQPHRHHYRHYFYRRPLFTPRCRISSAPIGEAKTLTVLPAQVDVAPCNEIKYLLCLYCLDYLYVAGDLDLGVAAFTPLLLTFTSALLTFTLLLLTFTPAQFGRLSGSLNYSKKIRKKIRNKRLWSII